MFNIKCLIRKTNCKIITNTQYRLTFKRFCQKENLPIKSEESKLTEIETETSKKLSKLSKIFPLDQVDQSVLEDVVKYKVLEDSVPQAVEELKKEVPEIAKHNEFRDWVKSVIAQDKQEEVLQKEGIVILKNKLDIFNKYGIDTHNYRKFHDRDYEVDIEEILTKDLYEKQRVVDSFVEENKKQINDLVGYFNNRFKFLNFNKHSYLIYQNNYANKMNFIKLSLIKNILSASILSFLFYSINPILLLLLIPEYYSIAYMFFLLNNLVDQIILNESKQSIIFRTFNFLGFKTELKNRPIDIMRIFYDYKIKNDVLNLNDKGFLFVTRLIHRLRKARGDKNKDLDKFKFFHKIRINGKVFYLPADCSTQHEDTNEELIINVLNNNSQAILEYDYSKYENRVTELINQVESFNKAFAKKTHSDYYTAEEKLKEKYSKYEGNRDFADEHYEMTLKRKDGADGTYTDNGYR